MPKSRNRKDHKKKVQARNTKLTSERNKAMQQMEELKEQYTSEMAKKAKEDSTSDSGDVPFTLGDK
jgi:cell division protein FtsB